MQTSLEKWVWGRDLQEANPIKPRVVAWKGLDDLDANGGTEKIWIMEGVEWSWYTSAGSFT